jgi:phosphoglycolate phosphatase
MTLRKPEVVLFDLDGTLIDTAPDLAASIDSTLQQLGLPARGEEKVRGWIGSGIEGVLKRALTDDFNAQPDAEQFNSALEIFKEIYFANVCQHSRIYPGVREALDYLEENNFAIACVTNKGGRFTDKLLKEIGLYERFGIIVSGDTLAVKKPDPLPILHAAKHFSASASATLMVGDSVTDVNAARAAGCQILCVPYGYNKGQNVRELNPDWVVESLAELSNLI